MRSTTSIVCIFCAFLYYVVHSACATKEGSYAFDLSQPDKFKLQKRHGSFDGLNLHNGEANLQKDKVRIILSEALTNKYYRKKLIEAMPMLSDFSPKQTFELSKLISSQIKSKPSSDEQIEKVSQIIFGNKSAMVLKLVNDIANHTRVSANVFNGLEPNGFLNIQSNRQSSQIGLQVLNSEKLNATIEDDVIDPITINGGFKEYVNLSPINNNKYNERHRRSASKLLHKLIRTSPSDSTGEQIQSPKYENSELKLNTSSFLGPRPITEKSPENLDNSTVLSYEQIEDLAFADLNGTDTEFKGNDSVNEQLPNPEELIGNPRYRISNKYHRVNYVKVDNKRKRIPVQSHHVKLLQKQCERFTASMCIKADDYPIELIMGSIRRHKNAMSALLAEYRDRAAELEYQEQLEEYQFNTKRREDGSVITPGGMCASVVRYARPQKARSASGEWKYIVNTGRHTQTLRLEKCSTPQESCSYLSHNYRSRCTQVYNYHRLLSWDKTRGLHVDIFKVPSCCSCQVDGYRETFPPLGATKHKDYTPVPDNNPYISVNDEIDYEDEDDDDAANAYHFGGGFNKNNYQHLELLQESKKIKTKVNHPSLNPTVGSYLSPPSDNYESKEVRPTYYTKSSTALSGRSRKPYKNFVPNESRADLVISETEQSDLEVKANAISDSSRVHHKRTRLYSGAKNAENRYQISGPIVSSESFPNYVTSSERSTTPLHNVGSNPITSGSNSRKEVVNGKRINYNYHPIIDFFGNHQKSGKGEHLLRNTATNSIPISAETSTYRNRRFEVGMEGSESNWHPVVVKS